MGRDALGIGAQYSLKRLLGAIELAICKAGLTKYSIRLQITWRFSEDMLAKADGPFQIITFEPLPGLIAGRSQAHTCHLVILLVCWAPRLWGNPLRPEVSLASPQALDRPIMRKATGHYSAGVKPLQEAMGLGSDPRR